MARPMKNMPDPMKRTAETPVLLLSPADVAGIIAELRLGEVAGETDREVFTNAAKAVGWESVTFHGESVLLTASIDPTKVSEPVAVDKTKVGRRNTAGCAHRMLISDRR